MKLTKCEQWVYDYVPEGDWVSPTQVGRAYGIEKHGSGHYKSGYHSAWGSPHCRYLSGVGLLERSGRGWYRKRKLTPDQLMDFMEADYAVITDSGIVWTT